MTTPRRPTDRARELRRAKHPGKHDCGPECFLCLVAQYAQSVRLQRRVYAPDRKRARSAREH